MTGRILKIIVPLALLALIVTAWAAETPEKMEARRLQEQAQAQPRAKAPLRDLPEADGPQDRLNNWMASQAANQSIIQDNYVARGGLNSVTIDSGLQLAKTSYDYQHNDVGPHQIGTNGSGQFIHFTWTHWDVIPESLNAVDRYVHFNSYNSFLGTFIYGMDGIGLSGAGGDPKTARAGFTTLALDDANRAKVAFHQRDAPEQPDKDYSSWVEDQSAAGFPTFTEVEMFQSEGNLLEASDDVIWPHVEVDQQAGADITHVLAHPYGANENIIYWRWKSTDVPQWKGPYVIDSTSPLSYNVACDRTSTKAALITLNESVYPANPLGIRQVVYRESPSNGDNWGPVNTTGLGDVNRVFVTSYNTAGGPGAWLETVGDYDNAGALHIVWNEEQDNAGTDRTAWKHWSALNGISTIHQAYYDNKGVTGGRDRNIAYPTLGFGDGSTNCGAGTNLNYIYMTFVQFGGTALAQQADKSAAGYMNGDIYLSTSNDGGLRWSPGKNLVKTLSPDCDPAAADSCKSENWPSIARTIDDTIHIMYVADRDGGDAVFGQGTWTFNPVMYYRIPGGTNVVPVCPLIAPNAGTELTDANGVECEYNTPPNTSVVENLILSNVGNATMTGSVSKVYVSPPALTWLQMTTGSYNIPAGNENTRVVTLNAAGLAEGLYKAEIRVTHNDPTKDSPIVMPVDFFVFADFACTKYVVLRTRWLELEVSNIERVAIGRSETRLRGLYRPPYLGSIDSGNNSIYDASLIIAKTPTVVPAPGDTLVYRYLYGTGNEAKGFRPLSELDVDTSRYGTNAGIAYARANQTTVDSIIGVDVEYQFPQNTDSSNFVLIKYKLYNRSGVSIPGLIIGEAADLDIAPSTKDAKWQNGFQNSGAFNSSMNLIYQQGVDSGVTNLAKKYQAGMTAIQCAPSPRAWCAPNNPWLTARPGSGWHEGYLYSQLVKNGFEIIPDPPLTTEPGLDRHSVIAFQRDVTLAPTTVKYYMMAFVTSTAGFAETDLLATTKKAWKFAFGWQTIVVADTLPESTPASYPYWASGSHENGPTSPCCGCVVTKVAGGAAQLTFVPDGTDPCYGVINFAGAANGTYTATFRVTTKTAGCTGPTYTDDQIVSIVVSSGGCNCPNQGDVDIVNSPGVVDVMDVIEEIAIAFSGNPDPQDAGCTTTRGDVDRVNSPGVTDVMDVIKIIGIAFSGDTADDGCI